MIHEQYEASMRRGRVVRPAVWPVLTGVLAAVVFCWAGVGWASSHVIRLGQVPDTFAESISLIAQQEGFFERNGLSVEIVRFTGDVIILRALVSGEIHIGSVGSYALINAIQKGAEVRAFVCPVPEQPHFLVAIKDIRDWKDLPGRNFGISQPGAISQTFPKVIMSRKGVDPNKVNYLAIGGIGARQKALLAGKVDATLLHMERALQVVKTSDKHHNIASIAEELPGVPLVYHTAQTKWLNNNPEVAHRYTKALIEAARFAVTQKPAMLKLGLKIMGAESQAAVEAAYESYRNSGVWGVNGGLSREGFDFTVKLGAEAGELKEAIAFGRVVDARFVDAVLKELGQLPTPKVK